MYRFYLDRTEVAEPESFTNISFEKKRDEKYFGFILRRKGIVKVVGAGQVKFTEEKAVAILRAAKERDGYGAIVKFVVYYQDTLAYEGTVNFWNAEFYNESVVVTFSDDANAVKFTANASTKYQIETNTTQTLGSSGVIGKTTHQISPTLKTFRKKTPSNTDFSHVVPFQLVSGSSNANVNQITSFDSILPIYTNDSEKKTVSIDASIFVNARAGSNIRLKVNELVIFEYPLTTTATDYIWTIDKTITLQPYETVTIKVVSVSDDDDVLFIYDSEKTVLSINEVKDVKDTAVNCISTFDLLSGLVNKATDGALRLNSYFISTLSHDWTNGKNLRGVSSVITTSFDDLFTELNKMYCLYCTITDTEVIIEQRKDIAKKGTKSYLDRDNITSEVKTPNRDFLYSNVKVGYKNWQLDSALSNQEVNAYMEYKTNLFGRENTLNLECDSIASGILIEEIRQMQFGKVTNEQQKKFDDTLVSLIASDGKADYMTSNVNEDARNLSIRPQIMLTEWAGVLGGYSSWKFTSGLGNYSAVIGIKSQNEDIKTFGNIISDDAWDLTYTCDLWEYTSIGDLIYWRDSKGINRKGILMEAQWNTSKEMILSIIEMKN